MNWIDIDKMLYAMIDRHQNIEDLYSEACKQFKWTHRQARIAIDPLLKRHTPMPKVTKTRKKRSKR